MRDCGVARCRCSDRFHYLVVAGAKEGSGLLPVIRRRHKVIDFAEEKDTDSVIRYVVAQGWFPRDTRWIEVYRVFPMVEEGKTHRRFDLDTLFKDSDDDEDRVRKQAG